MDNGHFRAALPAHISSAGVSATGSHHPPVLLPAYLKRLVFSYLLEVYYILMSFSTLIKPSTA